LTMDLFHDYSTGCTERGAPVAKWVVYENNRKVLTLLYRNAVNGAVFNCGDLRPDTPPAMIVQWVLEQAALNTGDLIQLQDGTTVQYLAPNTLRA
jgi:hypothetical protein